jgi:hypothetical protein
MDWEMGCKCRPSGSSATRWGVQVPPTSQGRLFAPSLEARHPSSPIALSCVRATFLNHWASLDDGARDWRPSPWAQSPRIMAALHEDRACLAGRWSSPLFLGVAVANRALCPLEGCRCHRGLGFSSTRARGLPMGCKCRPAVSAAVFFQGRRFFSRAVLCSTSSLTRGAEQVCIARSGPLAGPV